MKTIFVTGGHVTPAVAVMAELKSRHFTLYYMGRIHALEADQATSAEYDLVRHMDIQFLSLTAGRLQRKMTFKGLISICKIPLGFIQSCIYIWRYKPSAILTFGGYIGLPVSLVGALFRIPTVLHEQTLSPGLSNRIVARFAKVVCVSWEETKKEFAHIKVKHTGNPLREEIYHTRRVLINRLDTPLLYITGGNLGSHALNQLIYPILPGLLSKFTVVHQTGDAREFKDYEKMLQFKSTLTPVLAERYHPIKFVSSEYIGWVYANARLMVARSGANTVFEVVALQIPTIFIPLPWAARNEQQRNAEYLADRQAAVVLNQYAATSEKLLLKIKELNRIIDIVKQKLSTLQSLVRKDAASQIADVVESVA